MPFNVFGFTIKRTKDVTQPENIPSVVTADQQDGAVVVGADGTGYYGYAFNPLGEIKSEHDLLRRYREVAAFPEVDEAINNIVEEAIVFDDVKFPVELNLERTKLPDSIKKKFVQEFESILHLLEFDIKAHDMFRQYYVDGKLYFHLVFDGDNYKNGIADIRYIDPRKIRKIRNIKKDKTKSGVEIQTTIEEYYLYNDKGVDDKTQSGAKLTPDSVVYVNSGLLDQNNGLVLSHLQKAIKPANQLKMIEDAVVIYRLTRAPERRIFYVDVGTLPKGKAEQYVQEIMNKFRNRLIYDSATGEVADSKRHLSMMEDFWLPRRDGCFTLDTKIGLMDGRTVELGQLIVEHKLGKTNWVYSISPEGKVVPGMISWAGVTRTNTKVMRITLDNGEVITCTPDHKFILRNNVKIEAMDLVPGSSLMPFVSGKKPLYSSATYHYVKHNDGSGEQFTHRMVNQFIMGENKKSTEVIHHIDLDRYNNNPENLLVIDKVEHFLLHSRIGTGVWKNGDIEKHKRNLSESGKNFFKTEQGLQRRKEISAFNKNSEEIWNALQRGRAKIKENRAADKAILSHEEYLAKWSRGIRNFQLNGSDAMKEKMRQLKETLSPEEFKEYCLRFESRTKTMREMHSKINLLSVLDIIKNTIINSPRASNTEIVNNIRTVYPELKLKSLRRYLSENGYNSISDAIIRNTPNEYIVQKRREKAAHQENHSVVSIEFISEPHDVGTLTIDENHAHHDYHNFALSAGVFVMNSKGTEITTLPAGQSLGQMEDVEYFKNKLMRALNVPITRLIPEQGFSLGRSSEITRDELKFHKFIKRLRARFSALFIDILKVQLIAKGIIKVEEWDEISKQLFIEYRKDNSFSELKDLEILNNRLEALGRIEPYVGKYYSRAFVQKSILRFTEDEIGDLNTEIEQEAQEQPEQEQPDEGQGNE